MVQEAFLLIHKLIFYMCEGGCKWKNALAVNMQPMHNNVILDL